MNLNNHYLLSDGVKIPTIGFGTWQMENNQSTTELVDHALKHGYQHIDTAAMYGNEESIGKAIKNSGIPREELFITTKLDNKSHSYNDAKKAIETSLSLLGLEYIDLYLIHWPNPIDYRSNWAEANAQAWVAMEEAQKEGKIRTLGVSNFMPRHLDALLKTATIKPTVNQILLNPSEMQKDVVAKNKKYNILSEAYSPLGTGKIFEIEELKEISEKYNKTVAQIVLRWSLQHGFLPLPKTSTLHRVEENIKLFDFEISNEDMSIIDSFKGRAGIMTNPDEKPF